MPIDLIKARDNLAASEKTTEEEAGRLYAEQMARLFRDSDHTDKAIQDKIKQTQELDESLNLVNEDIQKRAAAQAVPPPAPAKPETRTGAESPSIQTRVAGSGALYLQMTPPKGSEENIKKEFDQFKKKDGTYKTGYDCKTDAGPPRTMTLTFPDEKSMNDFIKNNLLGKGMATLPPSKEAPQDPAAVDKMMERVTAIQKGKGSDVDNAAQAAAKEAAKPTAEKGKMSPGADTAPLRTALPEAAAAADNSQRQDTPEESAASASASPSPSPGHNNDN